MGNLIGKKTQSNAKTAPVGESRSAYPRQYGTTSSNLYADLDRLSSASYSRSSNNSTIQSSSVYNKPTISSVRSSSVYPKEIIPSKYAVNSPSSTAVGKTSTNPHYDRSSSASHSRYNSTLESSSGYNKSTVMPTLDVSRSSTVYQKENIPSNFAVNRSSSTTKGNLFTNHNYDRRTTGDSQNNQKSNNQKLSQRGYLPSKEVRIFYNQKFENLTSSNSNEYHLIILINHLRSSANLQKLTDQNYTRALRLFADIEDLYCEEEMRAHNRKNVQITRYIRRNVEYIISIPKSEEEDDYDSLITRKSHISIYSCHSEWFASQLICNATIIRIKPEHIVVEILSPISTDVCYDVHFECKTTILKMEKLDIKLKRPNNENEYIMKIPNLLDSRPAVCVNSRLMIYSGIPTNSKRILGTITDIQAEHILVEFRDTINTEILYNVDFLSNRTSLKMEKMAIQLMAEKKLVPFMFPSKFGEHKMMIGSSSTSSFAWFNESVADNTDQQIVIENIFNGTSYPYPYILFGPPGTGKTTTLVECILQLWQQKKKSRILVVSPSNFACNVISKRLLKLLPKKSKDIYRLFAKSQEATVDKIDSDVVKASNLDQNIFYQPQPDELYKYRIIISTLTASGRMVQDGFDTNFFTHLFIDECGSCTEGSALIPIAGLISTNNKINANIILAGDPLQLGPVIQSKYAEDMGYGTSMLERLMNFGFYKKDSYTDNYDSRFISKLRLNYRSNKDILHISNKLFYDSELTAVGPKEVTDWAINWDGLPNRRFPIKFVACFGESLRENDSPSLYNKKEITTVMDYLKLIVNKKINGQIVRQSDIGVITPYRKQNSKIRAMCDHKKWTDIEVASVEAFQGNEKKIIILSTVRSNVETLGFLNNEKRFNVAMTRAQALLIVIGNPKLLRKDKCWYQLIKFCHDNNAIGGEPYTFFL